MKRNLIYAAIDGERAVQDAVWSGLHHDMQHMPAEWAALLNERMSMLGSVADLLALPIEPGEIGGQERIEAANARYRRHLIELAAVAVAALEVSDHPLAMLLCTPPSSPDALDPDRARQLTESVRRITHGEGWKPPTGDADAGT